MTLHSNGIAPNVISVIIKTEKSVLIITFKNKSLCRQYKDNIKKQTKATYFEKLL